VGAQIGDSSGTCDAERLRTSNERILAIFGTAAFDHSSGT